MMGFGSARNLRSIQLRAFSLLPTYATHISLILPELQIFLPPSMVTLSVAATRVSVERIEQYDIAMYISFFSILTVVYVVG
jgi:hypothetical protein